jgi:antitoxin component of MazEF toxin-antitoxin module
MKRKLVQAGSSLAVTLPAEVVHEFKLKKGMGVDVSVHPQTGAVTIRPGVRYFENGKVTKRFDTLADEIAERFEESFRELAKCRSTSASSRSWLFTSSRSLGTEGRPVAGTVEGSRRLSLVRR